MRKRGFALIFGIVCACAALQAQVSHVSADEPTVVADPTPLAQPAKVAKKIARKIDPVLSPEYVALLKKHAVEREDLFEAQAKAKQELQNRQTKEVQDLLQAHREARHNFSDEKHTLDERAAFYRNQRAQMRALKARQESELAEFEAAQRKELTAFHVRQRQENASLLHELSQAR